MQDASVREKLSLCTILPLEWSNDKLIEMFPVTKYQLQVARELMRNTATVLAEPPPKRGKPLSTALVNIIGNHWEDAGLTRMAPGKNDTVSVKIDGVKIKKNALPVFDNERYVS